MWRTNDLAVLASASSRFPFPLPFVILLLTVLEGPVTSIKSEPSLSKRCSRFRARRASCFNLGRRAAALTSEQLLGMAGAIQTTEVKLCEAPQLNRPSGPCFAASSNQDAASPFSSL